MAAAAGGSASAPLKLFMGVGTPRNHNVFERDVTADEQAIIQQRVDAQRKMFAEVRRP